MYITSLLVAMERSLSSPPKNGWEKVNQHQVFELLHTVFCTLTAAMRYEPANSHFFKTEIQYEKLADAVRFLGCFSDLRKISPVNVFPSNTQPFQRLLEEDAVLVDAVSPTLRHCSKLFIYLYKVATDSFDRYGSVLCSELESMLGMPPHDGSSSSYNLKENGTEGISLLHSSLTLLVNVPLPLMQSLAAWTSACYF